MQVHNMAYNIHLVIYTCRVDIHRSCLKNIYKEISYATLALSASSTKVDVQKFDSAFLSSHVNLDRNGSIYR